MKSKQIIKDIKIQYPSLQKWGDNQAYSLYQQIQEQQIIKEFLYTVDANKTFLQLLNQVGRDKVFGNFEKKKDKITKIKLTFKNKLPEDLDDVNKFMEKFGWYPSYIDEQNGGKYSTFLHKVMGFKNITIDYEAKYDTEVDISKYKFIYHMTPDLKWSKIQNYGLTPKNQGKLSNHPERIYFYTKLDEYTERTDLAFSLLNNYSHKEKVKEMYLLKIDVSKLKDIKFFDDPNFFMGEAVWTYQNIPPNSISIEQKIDITY